jgi:hypothetical protein
MNIVGPSFRWLFAILLLCYYCRTVPSLSLLHLLFIKLHFILVTLYQKLFRSSFAMYISLLPTALLLSLVGAQTTSYSLVATTSSACAAQPVLEACLASTEAIANGCLSTDYSCLCQKWNDVYTYFLLFQSQSQTY